ncbi:MAG: 1-acyl-sn-glycerol-3-phosphate acyltransferase [Alphaproteobacteria bacterium]|nr:1-acyl-sn-glycerol-3-phosphate acyltransferase [Alphaproteobacteria bacterium]
MSKIKKPNIFNYISAAFRILGFVVFAIGFAIVLLFIPKYSRAGVKALSFFMRTLLWFSGSKIRVRGAPLSKEHPLLLIGNHISVFEISAIAAAFGNSFFSKDDVKHWPVIGWFCQKFGVIFINRSISAASTVVGQIQAEMKRVSWPMVIFPEGTTTNGAYVKSFKSAMFNFMEVSCSTHGQYMGGATVQPIVVTFRSRRGEKLSDADIAENFAWYANNKQDQEYRATGRIPSGGTRGLIAQVFHVFAIGGMTIEMNVIPPPSLDGICDRKQMAEYLHKIVSDEYMKLK